MYQKVLYLEIRDVYTFIPVMALKLQALDGMEINEDVRYLLSKSGFPNTASETYESYTTLVRLATTEVQFYSEGHSSDTMRTAHQYIHDNFEILNDGDVIDVSYIKGLSKEKKLKQRGESDLYL